MTIPHLPPVRFAQSIIASEEKVVRVACEFPSTPTLPMIFEAAAQSSAAFSQDGEAKIGFLVSVKDVVSNQSATSTQLELEVEKQVEFGAICEFSFKAYEKENLIATGSLTVMIQP